MYEEILKKYWGYDSFRPLQGDIIASIAAGQDTLGLMPTGGGKSLTFQVPTMAMEGLCLVVTPLIALMKDQVENLRAKGIKAAAIHTGMASKDIIRTLDNCTYGDYKFLYLSPERLTTELFLSRLPQLPVCLITVDESHCISQWGYDFRPSYLRIAEIRALLPGTPILALTATATPRVVTDIQDKLLFRKHNVFQKSFERPNLAYIVRQTENKLAQLIQILQGVPGSSVVYVRNRKKTTETAEFLLQQGISATHFHAGLDNETKDLRQKQWKNNEIRVIVATNAFGMGIDKPDVRTVIHLDLPDTLEAYFQEAGRAGRDELKAYAILLYNNTDATKIKKRINDNYPERDFITQVYDKLCNFFQIGIGSGLERTFLFDLSQFCAKFHLPILPTHSAITLLQQAGYLHMDESDHTSSRVLFTVTKQQLNTLQLNTQQEKIIYLLLRSYTGLFTEPAYVNEESIAKKLNITRHALYTELVAMSKEHIISYVPRKQMPYITLTTERITSQQIKISKAIYEDRKKQFIQKAESILHYAQQQTQCRNQVLLQYFGQTNASTCKQCDICLSQKEAAPQHKQFSTIRTQAIELLAQQPLTQNELIDKLVQNGHESKQVITVLRTLQDNGEIVYTTGPTPSSQTLHYKAHPRASQT